MEFIVSVPHRSFFRFFHKVLVFNDVRVNKIFGDNILLKHLFHGLFSQLFVIVDLSYFVNELTRECLDLTLVNISRATSSTTKLLELFDFQVISNILSWAIENLDILLFIKQLE